MKEVDVLELIPGKIYLMERKDLNFRFKATFYKNYVSIEHNCILSEFLNPSSPDLDFEIYCENFLVKHTYFIYYDLDTSYNHITNNILKVYTHRNKLKVI